MIKGTAAESPGGRVRENAEALSTQPALIQCLEAKPRGASYGSQVESREKAQVFHQRDRGEVVLYRRAGLPKQ